MSELRFEDRVAVITGGARGLGRAYALLLASRGAKVVVNDTGGDTQGLGEDAGAAAEVVEAVGSAGGQAVACIESVATAKGGEAIIQSALDHFGRIDILIHSAGNVRFAPLAEMSSEDFEAVLDVHLRGAFHVVRPAFSAMCEARYGRIVLTSSIAGIYGDRKVANYAAAKAGAIGLANVAALEGAEFGVRCNVILPGAVTRMAGTLDTQHLPPRMGPDMVAPAVAWLAHESCPLTGEMLVSLGGTRRASFHGGNTRRPQRQLDHRGYCPVDLGDSRHDENESVQPGPLGT
jgi:NAD(P)-dependent dehydrogenase (short-subunit alcohol dehydrogenase family)